MVSSLEEIKTLQEEFGIKSEKISHIINPIDLTIFKNRERSLAAEKISIDPNFKYLLYVGRLTKNKGLELLLDVFLELSKRNEDIKLIIIGEGPFLEYIKIFSKKNSIDEKILLTGRLTHNQTCFYYNVASMLINIGMSGGLANVILESLASNTPIIATDVGATREYINEKNDNGILIKPSDKNELKNAIEEILNNEKKFKNQNSDLLKNFSFESYGSKLASIYSDLLEK